MSLLNYIKQQFAEWEEEARQMEQAASGHLSQWEDEGEDLARRGVDKARRAGDTLRRKIDL